MSTSEIQGCCQAGQRAFLARVGKAEQGQRSLIAVPDAQEAFDGLYVLRQVDPCPDREGDAGYSALGHHEGSRKRMATLPSKRSGQI